MNETTNIFYMKEGDRLPKLQMTLLDDEGLPIDLTNMETIQLFIAPCVDGRRIVDAQSMAIVGDSKDGTVEYAWKAGDTDKSGEYKVEVVLTKNALTDAISQSIPRSGYDTLIITPRL